ncbi:MAG: response regulator, partial [Tunicatimonas sp.]
MTKILIIDDEKPIRGSLREILEYEKYTIEEAADGEEGLKMIADGRYDLVLCDIKMPKVDGIDVLQKAVAEGFDGQFIMISAHGTIETAVEATKMGA